jgi:hypothetical protein
MDASFCTYNNDWGGGRVARPKTGETPIKNVRVPQELWDAAKEEAAIEGRTITDVVNADLHRYVTRRRRERGAADDPA